MKVIYKYSLLLLFVLSIFLYNLLTTRNMEKDMDDYNSMTDEGIIVRGVIMDVSNPYCPLIDRGKNTEDLLYLKFSEDIIIYKNNNIAEVLDLKIGQQIEARYYGEVDELDPGVAYDVREVRIITY